MIDAFLEEKEKLEEEIKICQNELNDTLALNVSIATENREKDILIVEKGAYLASLKDKNKADHHQLEVERSHSLDSFEYEISIRESKLKSLQALKLRYYIVHVV